mgnify:CR=1 FL=1
MGRKRIYEESTTKTTTAQKKAIAAYRERQRGTEKQQKTIGITMTAAEVDADRATLEKYGLTVKEFWRKAIEELKAQPIPQPEEGTPGTPGEPAAGREDAPGDPGRE